MNHSLCLWYWFYQVAVTLWCLEEGIPSPEKASTFIFCFFRDVYILVWWRKPLNIATLDWVTTGWWVFFFGWNFWRIFDTFLCAWGFVENLTVHSPGKPENFVSFCQITIPLFYVLGFSLILNYIFVIILKQNSMSRICSMYWIGLVLYHTFQSTMWYSSSAGNPPLWVCDCCQAN